MDNRELFMTNLKALGGKASNAVMFETLGQIGGQDVWTHDYYVNVKEALKEEGRIKLGRGRGGTVMSREENEVES